MDKTATPTVRLSATYRAYDAITRRYLDGGYPIPFLTKIFLEGPIRFFVMILGPLHRFRFPDRATGGWWWIWRYRFEMLLGWYEYPTILWVDRLVRPGMFVVDIGAHIGYFSRLLARLVGSTGNVLAFEPSPENFLLLVHNLSQRQSHNVLPIQAAVAEKSGRQLLYVSPGHSNHSLVMGYTDNAGTDTLGIYRRINTYEISNWDLLSG